MFGNSAGAIDTGLLMTSTLSKDLFQRAIAESGTSFSHPLSPLAAAEKAGEAFAANLKVATGEEGLKQLRQLTAQQLLAFSPARVRTRTSVRISTAGSSSPAGFGLCRGWKRPRFPCSSALRRASSGPQSIVLPRRKMPCARPSRITSARLLLSAGGIRIGRGRAGQRRPALRIAGRPVGAADLRFRCPATAQGGWHNAAHHPTYEYEFAHAIPGQEAQGAVHGSELPYVFGYFPKWGNIAGQFTDLDIQLSGLMETYWTNFAKTGNPNSAGLPEWPPFGVERKFIRFQQDGKVVPLTSLRDGPCGVYRASLT